mmetsp:Transcript_5696/g.17853  ORF Transcript_5696/g.17853 Transcript_5696/m.17853 type:complete len:379 (-) Transcript_5696:338-1474(-)
MSDGNFTAESAAQHQSELNDYLQSKSINQLFIQIVESLLIEKPDNPISFIVEFLQKKYPDRAGVVVKLDTTTAGEANSDSRTELQLQEDSDDDEDDEEDEGNEPDNMPRLSDGLAYDRMRKRKSVCAEVLLESQDEIKEYEKKTEVKMRILEILEEQILFRHFDHQQKDFMARTMLMMNFQSGDIITKQGDAGDSLYVIDEGNVECLKYKDSPADQILVHTYGPGSAFGELAVMYNAPRAATCRAATSCRLYALNRKAFKMILMKTTIERRLQIKRFLQNVEILKQLKEHELFTMADAMRESSYEEGDVVCRQGDMGSSFYIIKQGTVSCVQADAQGKQLEVARLAAGDYFGEIALLTSKPRQASVIAAEKSGTLKQP